MAEVTGLRNNALPYPVYGAPWGVVFPMLDADGDLVTGATTPDAEVSLNGNTFADCTNESTEIATNSGMYYLLLTAAEMTADVVTVIAKSATAGMKTTPIVLYPRKLVTLRSGTVGANAADGTTLQLDSGASAVDDFYNGCLIIGTLDTIVEARIISDYVGSTKVCTISPAFITVPDNNDTFVAYLPEGRQVNQANVSHWNELAAVALPLAPTTAGRTLDVSAGGEAGVDWANVGSPTTALALTGTTIAVTQKVDVDTIKTNPVVNGGTATFPTNATLASTTNITAGIVTTATNVTTVNGLAANVITATSIAADAITDAKVASDVTIASVTGAVGSVTGLTAGDVGAIKAKTDNLPSDPADESLIIAATDAVMARLGAPAGASVSADVAAVKAVDDAIKAKTDSLTFTVAAKVDANVLALNGDATSAANIAKTTRAIARGTVGAASTTTGIVTSAFAPAGAAADQFKGRIITFDADTATTALRGQSTDITASSNASTPVLTVTALTTAPASGDTFSVT